MKRILLCLMLVMGCNQVAQAGEFLGLATGILATRRPSKPKPAPAPAPNPSGVCDNCGGSGKVGDGTIFVTCAACNGTGKKTSEPPPAPPPPEPAKPALPPAVAPRVQAPPPGTCRVNADGSRTCTPPTQQQGFLFRRRGGR